METTSPEGITTDLDVSLTVAKPLADVWSALMTPDGNSALLGDGGRLGSKGDDWRSTTGAYGVTRSFHPMEQIRFSWHADADAPAPSLTSASATTAVTLASTSPRRGSPQVPTWTRPLRIGRTC